MTEIYSRLVDHTITNTDKINDFSIGSAMRSMYEAIGIEVEQLYVLTRENIEEALEKGVYSSFGFKRREAIRAYGMVQIVFHNPIQQEMIISRGTRFASNITGYSQVYETLEDYIVPKGSIMTEVMAYSLTPGETGNIPKNIINVMKTPLANMKSVYNPQAIQTGQNREPLEELRSRFQLYIKSLSKATVPALEYGTREIPEVTGVFIHEETGKVTIYAHDRNGNLPESVKRDIEANMFYYRPAGIPVEIKPVTRKDVDVDVIVTIAQKTAITDRLRNDIQQKIERYLNTLSTSQHLIISNLSRVIMDIDKQLIYDVEFLIPTENVILKGSEIIRAGEVKVTLK